MFYAYQGDYSYNSFVYYPNAEAAGQTGKKTARKKFEVFEPFGGAVGVTPTNLPENVKITYKGDVFDQNDSSGRFHYYVDFKDGSTMGYGSFSPPRSAQKYILEYAELTDENKFYSEVVPAILGPDLKIKDINEEAPLWGRYKMQLFGANAEEIAGFAYNYDKTEFYGFNGTGSKTKSEDDTQ